MIHPAATAPTPAAEIEAAALLNSRREARLFTFSVSGERFALPVARVQTVFHLERVTPVPFAPPFVIGLVNLRGKIVTAISLRRRLCLAGADDGRGGYAVCVERGAESIALSVDQVGDVLRLPPEARLPTPPHIETARAAMTVCVYRLDEGMLPLLDIDALLAFERI